MPVLLFSLFLGASSYSADFNKGLTAAQSGDFATALKEWKPLAGQGDADAQTNLGLMYQNGWGVPQDDKEAVRWYTLAAEQGYANAQYNLGQLYREGDGVPQDYKLASEWFRLAAEQGDARSQYNLGVAYYKGDGLIQDKVYSHMWVNIASSNGYVKAKENLTVIEKTMTSSDISEAQRLARECVKKNYKGC